MATKRRKRSTVIREIQVDICPRNAGLILSIGRMSIWLEHDTAREVVTELTAALGGDAPRPASGRAVRGPEGSN